jgi:hypothetical protein
MRGSAWHYATRLSASKSFCSVAGWNGCGQAAGGRSYGKVGISTATLGSVSVPEPSCRHFGLDWPLSVQELRQHKNFTVFFIAVHPLPVSGDLGDSRNPAPGVCTLDSFVLSPALLPSPSPPGPSHPPPTRPHNRPSAGMLLLSFSSLRDPRVCPGTRTPSGFRRSPPFPSNSWPRAGRDVSSLQAGTSRSRR